MCIINKCQANFKPVLTVMRLLQTGFPFGPQCYNWRLQVLHILEHLSHSRLLTKVPPYVHSFWVLKCKENQGEHSKATLYKNASSNYVLETCFLWNICWNVIFFCWGLVALYKATVWTHNSIFSHIYVNI